jgi:hypothetical protein
VRGDVEGSVTSRCNPRKTAAGISESRKYGTPATALYRVLSTNKDIAAIPATRVIEKKYITIKPMRNKKV